MKLIHAAFYEKTYDRLREKILAGPLTHADETGVKVPALFTWYQEVVTIGTRRRTLRTLPVVTTQLHSVSCTGATRGCVDAAVGARDEAEREKNTCRERLELLGLVELGGPV